MPFIGNKPTAIPLSADDLEDNIISTAKIQDNAVTAAKYIEPIPFRNIIINGDMSLAQRGTSTASITGTDYHTVDRFKTIITTLGTWTQSQSTDVPTAQGFSKSLKMDCTTADGSPASGDSLRITTHLEGQNLQYLKKGTSSAESLTASFWVKSNKTGTYICALRDRDNSRDIAKSYTISSADTWEKKTITFEGDTTGAFDNDNARSLDVIWGLAAGSDYSSGTLQTTWGTANNANVLVGQVNLMDSTSNEWFITGVQLEAGTTASDFEFLPYDVNLKRCRRYFQKNDFWIDDGGSNFMKFYLTPMQLNPEMRSSPTVYDSTDLGVDTGDGETKETGGTNRVGIAASATYPTLAVLIGADHNGVYQKLKGRVWLNAEL